MLPKNRVFEASMTLPLGRDEVFAFFAEAQNLERITPPELGFRIISPTPIDIAEGTLIDYQLSLFGLPFTWRSRIARWDPPHAFVDEQLKGPYSFWHHTHTFAESSEGTVIGDRILYRLPLWPLSAVGLPLVKLQLKRIFAYRQQAIRKLLLH